MNCQRSYLYERCAHLCKSWYRWTCMCGFSSCLISNVLSLSPALCLLLETHIVLNLALHSALFMLTVQHILQTVASALEWKVNWGVNKPTTHLKFWSRFISIVTFQGWTSLCDSVLTWQLIFAVVCTSDFPQNLSISAQICSFPPSLKHIVNPSLSPHCYDCYSSSDATSQQLMTAFRFSVSIMSNQRHSHIHLLVFNQVFYIQQCAFSPGFLASILFITFLY